MTKATIDWKARLLVQIADLQKEAENVDVENGGLKTLGCITRITIELERLNMEFRTATFIDAVDSVVPAFGELNQALESATESWRSFRG